MTGTGDSPEPSGKKPSKKADNATIALRIEEVLRIRLDGAQMHDIVQYASEKQWGVSERQLWNYVRKADELLVERLDKDSGKVIARHIAQRQALYARCVNNADLRTALAVLDSEAKLRGLFPDQIAKTKDVEATTKSAPLIIIAGPEVITPPPEEPEVSGG